MGRKGLSDRKKVLVVVTAGLYLAGITTVMLDIADYTKEQYHLSFVLAESGDPKIIKQLEQIGPVYQLPSRRRFLPVYLYRLRQIMKQGQYDAVHIHGNSATMAFDLYEAYQCRIPRRITHCHNCAPQPRLKQITLKRAVNRYVTHPAACSQASGNMLYDRSFTVIRNCIDCDRFQFSAEARKRLRTKLAIAEDTLVVGHVGRFSKQKNQGRLIRIFMKVLETEPKACLLLCGDGETLDQCKHTVEKLHLQDNVIFTGETDKPEDFYSVMDVFVLPSLFEGLPLVGVEAQANGLPCVFSDTITTETGITEDCRFVPLTAGDDVWAGAIIGLRAGKREEAAAVIKEAGFDKDTQKEQVLKLYA